LALLFDFKQALLKLQFYFFPSGHLTLHPWMTDNVSHAKSLFWVELQHIVDQVFEIFREGESLFLILPKLIISVSGNHSIKLVILWVSISECHPTRVQNKKDGAK
jgi:hypothetical protein